MLRFLASLALGSLLATPVLAADWPRQFDVDSGRVTVYQPQLERIEGDDLLGRAAVSWRDGGSGEPVFGAMWLTAEVDIDRDEGVVHVLALEITDTRFPEGNEGLDGEIKAAVARYTPDGDLDFLLDELVTSLAAAEEVEGGTAYRTDPPAIVYRDHPAMLLLYDGDPVRRGIENTGLEAVINTPYPVICDGRNCYLNAARDVWYRGRGETGPFTYTDQPPGEVAALVDQDQSADESTVSITADNAPEIVVATTPTELLVSDGPADFAPLTDGLLLISNSQSSIFMHVPSQQYYTVLSGRWYAAPQVRGPWAFVASEDLPADFQDIPADGDQAEVRAYIAGTDEAREAVMDAQVPQTAAVERGEVDLEVSYDGEPRFEAIEDTDLEYAVNTDQQIIRQGRRFFMVNDGVWYVADDPDGPWSVSDERPEGIEDVPPSSPVYNTRYVHVYESTPEVVYVGYTPGYMGSYVYGPTVVYGTGWYYRPWISPYYYYPRYSTWGFHVHYNPWTGWSFGMSWNYGPFHVGFHSGGYWHHGYPWYRPGPGWYGPGGYRPYVGNININNNITINNNRFNNFTRDNPRNLYRRDGQPARVASTRDIRTREQLARGRDQAIASGAVTREGLQQKTRDLNRDNLPNNVLADRDGNVFQQRPDGGYQQYDRGQWKDVDRLPADRPSSRPQQRPTTRPAQRPSQPTTRPATRPTTRPSNMPSTMPASRPSSRPSTRPATGYSRPSSVQAHSHARSRAQSRAMRAPPRGRR